MAVWFSIPSSGQITFQKQLDSLNGLFCLEQTADSTFWIGTYLGKIIRLDQNGTWIGGYKIQKGDTAGTRFIYDLERAPDGGIWALYDRTNNNNALDDYLILAKLGPDGLPLWQTPVHYGEVLHWAHNRLGSDPEGNAYAMSARFSAPGSNQPSRIIMSKVSGSGAIIWSKAYFNTGVNFPRSLQRLKDGSFMICGNGQLASLYGFVLRLSADGEVLWSRRFNHFLFKTFAELPDGGWIFAATEAGPLPQATCVLRMDADGTILWARRLMMPYALNWLPGLLILPNGNILVCNYETPKEEPVADMICLSPDGSFQWAKRYDLCHNYGISSGLITNDGGIAGLRYRPGGHLLLKTDGTGNCPKCPSDEVFIPMENTTDVPANFDWQSEDRAPPFPASSDYIPFVTNVHDYCGNEPAVTGISAAPAELCVFQPLSVASNGNSVADNYKWQFPGGTPASVSGYGAVSGIHFTTPGTATVTLIASTGFCKDTFSTDIKILAGPAPIDLGGDTTLCGAFAVAKIDATTPGATTYAWNDGVTDPIRNIDETGDFIVTASNGACTVSDTIRIQILEGLSINLPGDTTICGSDTLWLDASTPLASSYSWRDGYNTARRPVTEQGYYVVTAARGDCIASEFITVNPFPAPPPLPLDTLVCGDQPVTFNVGKSLAGEIQWNGDPGYSQFTFEDTGWVRRVIDYQHCHFEDSVYVRRAECKDGFAFYAPNVFSPNGDGVNDDFEITGTGLEILALQVFDRWGNLLYTAKNENHPRWTGTVNNRALSPGVYGWVARVRQGGREGWISGDVLVLR